MLSIHYDAPENNPVAKTNDDLATGKMNLLLTKQ